MIDQSITEIYQRDGKVFIPDFGAFIYSEITDTTDFNDLLTFDDGKLISEIQKQQNLPEDEAWDVLNQYIEDTKSTINQGNLHFIEGIGYLAKDTQGVFSIQETLSSPDSAEDVEVQESESTDINVHEDQLEDNTELSDAYQEEPNIDEPIELDSESFPAVEDLDEEQTNDNDFATATSEEEISADAGEEDLDEEQTADDDFATASSEEEISTDTDEEELDEEQKNEDDFATATFEDELSIDNYESDLDVEHTNDEDFTTSTSEDELSTDTEKEFPYNPVLAEEDEDVQQYYERKEAFYMPKIKQSLVIKALWITIPIILIASAAYYYFNYYNADNGTQMAQSSQSPPAKVTEENKAKQTPIADTKNDKKGESKNSSASGNKDDSKSNDLTKATTSASVVNKRTSNKVLVGQKNVYSLILGSFKEESNADKFVVRLRRQGMEVGKFQRGNDFYFVGFERIQGKSNAVNQLKKIKEEEPSAWIIKKI
jgi:hypothetical protein